MDRGIGRALWALCAVVIGLLGGEASGHELGLRAVQLREESAGVFRLHASDARDERDSLRAPSHCVVGEEGRLWRCGQRGLRGERLWLDERGVPLGEVLLAMEWLDGREWTASLGPKTTSVVVPAEVQRGATPTNVGARLWRYGGLGVRHILPHAGAVWASADHLLFLLGLVWLLRGAGQMLSAITAFTVGHSAALALLLLGHLHTTSQAIEGLIAASVVWLGWQIVQAERQPVIHAASQRGPWTLWGLGLGFGLLHGLGFAGALVELGLPEEGLGWAVLGFNGGVEVGQIVWIAGCLPLRALWRRWSRPGDWRAIVPGYVIGSVASALCLSRVLVLWDR